MVSGPISGHYSRRMPKDHKRELERILDDLAYELTGARTAGLDEPDELRAALRRARDLLAEADGLAAAVGARRSRGEDL